MPDFRRLVHEAHRRSIWQVLSVYLVTAWVVLQVADVLTQSLGLPEWVPGFALVLLLLGLPVVLATAIVQEGGPGRGTWRGDDVESVDDGHLMAGEPHPILAASDEATAGRREPEAAAGDGEDEAVPGFVERHLTWRNAVLGGVAAFAVLGFVVAAYFAMWATGVGPVGSLVAQGVLDERERVVLADFTNATPDPTVGDVVTEALRVDLVQSPVLTVADASFVDQVLQRMERDPTAPLTPALAREVAVREGLKAIIQGEVASAGGGFLLTASIVLAEDGRTLAAFRETAESEDELIEAIDVVSRRIREKAGESLPSIRAGEPLGTVTTSSLRALRLYTEGLRLEDRGRFDEALSALEEAVEADSAFAMAWRKISVVRSNASAPRDAVRSAAAAAYRHRDRLTERERYLAEAYYHDVVSEDREAARQAYRRVLRLDPDEGVALNNLALSLHESDRYEEAATLLERAMGGPGESVPVYQNLFRVRIGLGDTASAAAVLDRLRSRWPEVTAVHSMMAFNLALIRGDLDAARDTAEQMTAERSVPASLRVYAATGRALTYAAEGRLESATGGMRRAIELAEADGRVDMALELKSHWTRTLESLTGSSDEARRFFEPERMAATFRSLTPVNRPWMPYISGLVHAGLPDEARRVHEAWAREMPADAQGPGYEEDRLEALARIQAEAGSVEEALASYHRLRRARDCRLCYRMEEAELLAKLERTDEAVEVLEDVVDRPAGDYRMHPLFRAVALERLGELRARQGDAEGAAVALRRFTRLWAEADARLQPRVESARGRLRLLNADG